MTEELIKTYDLSIGYHGKSLVSGLDISLHAGKVAALLGSNGIGKSTLIKTLCREIPPIGGRITLEGKNINDYSRKELAKKLAIVTTDHIMAGGLTAWELVALGRHPHTGFIGTLSDNDRNIVEKAIRDVGIKHKADSYIAELSDGERQKVLIARAIAQQSPIIILDEPFSFLDTAVRIDIFSLLLSMAKEKNIAVLLSSHDVSQAVRMADTLWLMFPDHSMLCGTPESLTRTRDIERLFTNKNVIYDNTQCDFILKNR